jgi:DNA-binding NtrC family response regulator
MKLELDAVSEPFEMDSTTTPGEPNEIVVRLDQPMSVAIRRLEQSMVKYALKKCGGKLEETATMLGLSRKGLYLKRKRLGIEPDSATPIARA